MLRLMRAEKGLSQASQRARRQPHAPSIQDRGSGQPPLHILQPGKAATLSIFFPKARLVFSLANPDSHKSRAVTTFAAARAVAIW